MQKSYKAGKWLEELDRFLRENLKEITLKDIHDIYYEQYEMLRILRGEASQFTGLSEFILFRLLFHWLQDSQACELKRINHKDMFIFSDSMKKISIGSSWGVAINGHEKKPDILVTKNGDIKAAAQIKITRDFDPILKDLQTLDSIHVLNGGATCMFFLYLNHEDATERTRARIAEETMGRPWLGYYELQNNGELVANVFKSKIHF